MRTVTQGEVDVTSQIRGEDPACAKLLEKLLEIGMPVQNSLEPGTEVAHASFSPRTADGDNISSLEVVCLDASGTRYVYEVDLRQSDRLTDGERGTLNKMLGTETPAASSEMLRGSLVEGRDLRPTPPLSPLIFRAVRALEQERHEIIDRFTDETIYAHAGQLEKLIIRQGQIEKVLRPFAEYIRAFTDSHFTEKEIAGATLPEEKRIWQDAKDGYDAVMLKAEKELTKNLVAASPLAGSSAIVEIKAGIGHFVTFEAAHNMFTAYRKYLEDKGFKVTVEELTSPRPPARGIKEIVFKVEGEGAYELLQPEGGIHRIEANSRDSEKMATGSVAVAVFPAVSEDEFKIDQKDLRIETKRSQGPGGQNVNKTESAVVITHVPTGIQASVQTESSQLRNRTLAMEIIRARLYATHEKDARAQKLADRNIQIGSRHHAERMRTVDYINGTVTDYRPEGNATVPLKDFLKGDLDSLFEAVAASEFEERLRELVEELESRTPLA